MKKSWTAFNILSKNLKKDNQNARKIKIEKGARDFAVRFEDVMKDLAKG